MRQEEAKKNKAKKAVETRIKLTKAPSGHGNSSLPPKNPKRFAGVKQESHNDDLDFIMDDSDKRSDSIRAGPGQSNKRSVLDKKGANKRSTLMNAGMSASRKGLQDQEKSERSNDNNY